MDVTVPGSAKRLELPAELQDLALELALALHARGMYPSSHPLLQAALERLRTRIDRALAERGEISLGIAHHQVVIEGVATDDGHPLLRTFALHLHQHQIAALRISAGVESQELDDFLITLSTPALRADQPLGLLGPDVLQRWKHIALFPAVFDKLELIDEADSDHGVMAQSRAAQLWVGLARAALSAEAGGDENYDPSRVARAIDSHTRERAYDDVIIGHLMQMSTEMSTAGPASRLLRQRLSTMVRGLRPQTLSRLLEMGGDLAQRKRFVMFSADALSTGAVLDIFSAAGKATGHPVATAMTHLLTKLAQNAEKRDYAPGADQDLRRHVKSLVTEWSISDPNPEEYNQTLTQLSTAALRDDRDYSHRDEIEPERVLELSLAVDALGHDTSIALKRLVSRDGLPAVIDRLLSAPPNSTRQTLLERLLNPSVLHELLRSERPDLRSLKQAVAHLRDEAIDLLLAALEERGERDASWLTELIAMVGAASATRFGKAFPGVKPMSQRVLLSVFEQWNVWPVEVNLRVLATNTDPLIRRDAVRLLLKSAATRDEGLSVGLSDNDERVFRQVLFAPMRGATAEAAAILIQRAEDVRMPEELRARTIRALAATGRPEAMRWLIECCSVARRGFPAITLNWRSRAGLRRKSSTTLAAIAGLAAHWATAPEAAAVLDLAARSRDPEFRNAAMMHSEAL
jgi:hypothetical protein